MSDKTLEDSIKIIDQEYGELVKPMKQITTAIYSVKENKQLHMLYVLIATNVLSVLFKRFGRKQLESFISEILDEIEKESNPKKRWNLQ